MDSTLRKSAPNMNGARSWAGIALVLLCAVTVTLSFAANIEIVSDAGGDRLQVDGKDFIMNGMNWDYFPIGTNYSYSLWNQTDDIIKSALDAEMSLLQNMGVNVIRQYTGIPAKWITYIYEKYGIYTMLNHSFGRYGLPIDGTYVVNTEYSDPKVREILLQEVQQMVNKFKDVPGVIMYLLGNENNYGLFWSGAETEDIPVGETVQTVRARHMYKLFDEATVLMKELDADHPVAICNGDVLFIDIIAEECKNIDVFGTNMYRGESFGNAFEEVKEKLNVPIMFTEFGADAFSAVDNKEDQFSQAHYMVENWKEIYEQTAGKGTVGNSIGGFTFQFSDGWWKYAQTENLDVHDNNASWSNGGYLSDYTEDGNNMNEEWFGICAKGPTSIRGTYELFPRAAYYALAEAHRLNPYAEGVDRNAIQQHFSDINLMDAVLTGRGDQAALTVEELKSAKISGMRLELTTFNTGGDKTSTPDDPIEGSDAYPSSLGFDHMQSLYIDVEANPTASVSGSVSINILGNVPTNPMNEVFFENRGRPVTVMTENGTTTLTDVERVKIYNASVSWKSRNFDLVGFYRTGHFHWGYEGDFFGLYPEANYGANIDMYNGTAPFGVEITGKTHFNGFTLAMGPELWWGANPAVLLKYSRQIGRYAVTGIFHEDIDEQAPAVSSFAVPVPPTRRASIHVESEVGPLGVQVGGLWSGEPRVGEVFQIADKNDGAYSIYQDEIDGGDTFGSKVKFTLSHGGINWYAQGAVMGLVAGGGGNWDITYTGWRLKDSGSGNQYNALTGFTMSMGDWQIAPNFLWQKPIEGPIPGDVPAPGRPRNVLSDPFAVRANRETTAGELLLTYDPTPGSWMYSWDSDMTEDAPLAASIDYIYRHHPTTQDAAIGILSDGRTLFPFGGAPPARDMQELNVRVVANPMENLRFILNMYVGDGEPNGDDTRKITRFGGDLRLVRNSVKLIASAKFDDWGPYDYHRDFNLTYPMQLMADISTFIGDANWFGLPQTRMGIRYSWRSLDEYSPRYCPTQVLNASGDLECDPLAGGYSDGNEWEIRTYLHFALGR